MIPAADPLLVAPDGAPSLVMAGLRMMLAVVLLAAAAGAWFYWQRRFRSAKRHLEVIDRAFLARGASVALLRVGEKQLLVGVSAEGVRFLGNLDGGDPSHEAGSSFRKILDETRGGTEVET